MRQISDTSASQRVHLSAQLAACRSGAGIALTPRSFLFELRGGAPDMAALGEELTNQPSTVGPCVDMPYGWWRLVSRQRARVLLGSTPDGRRDLGRLLALDAWQDVALTDIGASYSTITIVGRKAQQLAGSHAARLARPDMVVAPMQDCRLLVVDATSAVDAYKSLLQAGSADGAIEIPLNAVHLHLAASRVLAAQRGRADRGGPVCSPATGKSLS